MTSTRPLRRMILHFSHMGLTEGRTFKLISLSTRVISSDSFGPALATGTVAATALRSGAQRKQVRHERNAGC
jgi:hypothetical protein